MTQTAARPIAALLIAAAFGTVAASAGAQPPAISAPAAIAIEASTGDIAYSRAPDQRRPIASATKLMTALLVLERSKLSDVVPAARYRALPVESKINLRAGELRRNRVPTPVSPPAPACGCWRGLRSS